MRKLEKDASLSKKGFPPKKAGAEPQFLPIAGRKMCLSSLQGTPCLRQVTEGKGLALRVSWDTTAGKRNPYGGVLSERRAFGKCQIILLCKLGKICRKFLARWFILVSHLCDKKSVAPPYVQNCIGKLQYQYHDKPLGCFATYYTQVSHLGQKSTFPYENERHGKIQTCI